MKKAFLTLLITFVSVQSYASSEHLCLDAKTGADAGKIRPSGLPADKLGNGTVIYSSLSTSEDGWLLTITENGELFNADLMVQHGRAFYVGTVQYENFQLRANINGRKMLCE